jgi:hypothetical protein
VRSVWIAVAGAATLNVVLSVAGGIFAAWLGTVAARAF